MLCRIVRIAVQDGVDGGFAHCHCDVWHSILVETSARCEVFGGPFYYFNTVDG